MVQRLGMALQGRLEQRCKHRRGARDELCTQHPDALVVAERSAVRVPQTCVDGLVDRRHGAPCVAESRVRLDVRRAQQSAQARVFVEDEAYVGACADKERQGERKPRRAHVLEGEERRGDARLVVPRGVRGKRRRRARPVVRAHALPCRGAGRGSHKARKRAFRAEQRLHGPVMRGMRRGGERQRRRVRIIAICVLGRHGRRADLDGSARGIDARALRQQCSGRCDVEEVPRLGVGSDAELLHARERVQVVHLDGVVAQQRNHKRPLDDHGARMRRPLEQLIGRLAVDAQERAERARVRVARDEERVQPVDVDRHDRRPDACRGHIGALGDGQAERRLCARVEVHEAVLGRGREAHAVVKAPRNEGVAGDRDLLDGCPPPRLEHEEDELLALEQAQTHEPQRGVVVVAGVRPVGDRLDAADRRERGRRGRELRIGIEAQRVFWVSLRRTTQHRNELERGKHDEALDRLAGRRYLHAVHGVPACGVRRVAAGIGRVAAGIRPGEGIVVDESVARREVRVCIVHGRTPQHATELCG